MLTCQFYGEIAAVSSFRRQRENWERVGNNLGATLFPDPAAFFGSNPYLGGVCTIPGLRIETWGTLKSEEESDMGHPPIVFHGFR